MAFEKFIIILFPRIDIIEISHTELWAKEIKRSSNPTVTKEFHIACADFKTNKKYVVYAGDDTFSMGNEITGISLKYLMHLLLKL